ncbi:MAG: hypothetical protein EBU90_30295, partial [Proteobacteria bacterium]|nr:hypothetical protein [Pseudomonadota bacterium]
MNRSDCPDDGLGLFNKPLPLVLHAVADRELDAAAVVHRVEDGQDGSEFFTAVRILADAVEEVRGVDERGEVGRPTLHVRLDRKPSVVRDALEHFGTLFRIQFVALKILAVNDAEENFSGGHLGRRGRGDLSALHLAPHHVREIETPLRDEGDLRGDKAFG